MKTNEVNSLIGALWFKDRKGDIFAFHDGSLSIFKYHLKKQKMVQIELRKHSSFERVRASGSVVYVPQTDRVYYFGR